MTPSTDPRDPLAPPPAGRLAARYAERMRALAGPRRTRDAGRPDGSTAADTADSLRWAKPGRRSVRRTSLR